MTDLGALDDVRALQAHLRASLDTPAGQAVMTFLEEICGWYDFTETDPHKILVAHGKRQIVATLKTLQQLTPEQVVALMGQEA